MLHISGTNSQRTSGILNLSALLNPVIFFSSLFSPSLRLFFEATQMLASYTTMATEVLYSYFILYQFISTCVFV